MNGTGKQHPHTHTTPLKHPFKLGVATTTRTQAAKYKEAKGYSDIQEGTVNNYVYPALKKIRDADPAAYNEAHGCKATPAKPDQKPGKDVKPGKDGKADNKAQNTKKEVKKAPVKVKNNSKNVKGGLAHTGAVAASLAGIALASVAGGTGVVAWRRRKA